MYKAIFKVMWLTHSSKCLKLIQNGYNIDWCIINCTWLQYQVIQARHQRNRFAWNFAGPTIRLRMISQGRFLSDEYNTPVPLEKKNKPNPLNTGVYTAWYCISTKFLVVYKFNKE